MLWCKRLSERPSKSQLGWTFFFLPDRKYSIESTQNKYFIEEVYCWLMLGVLFLQIRVTFVLTILHKVSKLNVYSLVSTPKTKLQHSISVQ